MATEGSDIFCRVRDSGTGSVQFHVVAASHYTKNGHPFNAKEYNTKLSFALRLFLKQRMASSLTVFLQLSGFVNLHT